MVKECCILIVNLVSQEKMNGLKILIFETMLKGSVF